jgi:hypothetical protein
VSETNEVNDVPTGPSRSSTRIYVIIALVLIAVIVVITILLVTQGLPALRGEKEPTAVIEVGATATLAPTFTPGPTKEPTNTPPPPPSPTASEPLMLDTDVPLFDFESAGARPSTEWTGFFGEVWDAQAEPLAGVSIIVWYRDGTPASPIVKTDEAGAYEIRLADAPLEGTWSIQLLADDGQPISKLFTFQTHESTESGIQQIQVIWKEKP